MRFKEYLVETVIEEKSIIKISNIISNYLNSNEKRITREIYKDKNKWTWVGRKDIGKIKDILRKTISVSEINNLLNIFSEKFFNIKILVKDKIDNDDTIGEWNSDYNLITLKLSLLTQRDELRSFLVHELRHALDTFKGASNPESLYWSPRNKTNITNDEHELYQNSRSEINARFSQALDSINKQLNSPFWEEGVYNTKSIQSLVNAKFKSYDIAYLFPEKTESKEYKRLVKRAVEYIQHRLENK